MSEIDTNSAEFREAIDQFAERAAKLFPQPWEPGNPPPGVLAALDELFAAMSDAPRTDPGA